MSARKLWLIIASAFVLGAGALFYAQKAYPETFLLPLSGLPLVPLANLSMPSMPSMPNISAFTDVLPSGAPRWHSTDYYYYYQYYANPYGQYYGAHPFSFSAGKS